jgi:AcrR family transcriptional regulator
MGSPTAREPLSRVAVVSAARELIEDEGLEAVSFRRLAQRLGVTAPALYAYVSDKDDLLRSVTANEVKELIGRLKRPEGEEPIDSLRRFCHVYIDYAVSHPELYKTMFQFPPWDADAQRTSFGVPVTLAQMAVAYGAVVEALDRGLLRPEHPLLVALTMWTALHGLAEVLRLGAPTGELRERFAELVIDSVIDGLRPRT